MQQLLLWMMYPKMKKTTLIRLAIALLVGAAFQSLPYQIICHQRWMNHANVPLQQQKQHRKIKVFSSSSHHPNARKQQQDVLLLVPHLFDHIVYNQSQQRDFLLSARHLCGDTAVTRFDELLHLGQAHVALQIWNYCELYLHGGVLLDTLSSSAPLLLLLPLDTLLFLDHPPPLIVNDDKVHDDDAVVNMAILNDDMLFPDSLHTSFLYLSQPRSPVAWGMLQVLLGNTTLTELITLPLLLPTTLYNLVQQDIHGRRRNVKNKTALSSSNQSYNNQSTDHLFNHTNNNRTGNSWHFLEQKCTINPLRFLPHQHHQHHSTPRKFKNQTLQQQQQQQHYPCPSKSTYCCHVYDRDIVAVVGLTPDSFWPFQMVPSSSLEQMPKPYHPHYHPAAMQLYKKDDVPYMATLRERKPRPRRPPQIIQEQQEQRNNMSMNTTDNNTSMSTTTSSSSTTTSSTSLTTTSTSSSSTTTSLWDTLLQKDCLPSGDCVQCFRNTDLVATCQTCQKECSCYCTSICNTSIPQYPISKEILVQPPRYKVDPSRFIPRIIHQTWFEEIDYDKYPKTSRLMESFRQSGWEHRFYTDDMMAAFLTTHFPKQVQQAYHDLLPGAFKADLFRYCVLLIHGGLYADIDILLESNLDAAIEPDVGFFIPYDSFVSYFSLTHCFVSSILICFRIILDLLFVVVVVVFTSFLFVSNIAGI
jgi:hypothetical protein